MTVHVIGAGLAGLSAALVLARAGREVAVHEAAPQAGGRCRSYDDATLGCRIDNGNHLVVTGNGAVRRHLARTGAQDALVAAPEAAFPFADLETGERWAIDLGRGRTPFALLRARGRPPGMSLADALGAVRLMLAEPRATVAEAIPGRGPAWHRFWVPMTLAVLNAAPERAQARLLWSALSRSFARGGAHCRPMFAPEGLGAALIEPALRRLEALGATVRIGRRLLALGTSGEARRATALTFTDGHIGLRPHDAVILAVPPSRLVGLMPALDPPGDATTILNAHFRLGPGALDGAPPLLGVLGAHTHWIFTRGDVASVTISGAQDSEMAALPHDEVAGVLWGEVRRALDLGPAAPLASRVVKEKRATFDQSPGGVARRLPVRTHLGNVALAGDHVRTGLPATIEGALRSGEMAAAAVMSRRPPASGPSGEPGPIPVRRTLPRRVRRAQKNA